MGGVVIASVIAFPESSSIEQIESSSRRINDSFRMRRQAPRTFRRTATLFVLIMLAPGAVSTDTPADDTTTTTTDTSTTIQCATGWTNQQVKEIPQDWIDDGYCDCPFDGADEPNTGACSGSQAWPGIVLPSAPVSEEEEEDSPTSSSSPPLTFQCPEQPALKLPASRLSDGICDCCDGADEAPEVCEDICEEVLKAEREARAKLEQAFAVGQNKRKHELFAFKKLREEKLAEIEELEKQKESLDPEAIAVKMEGLQLGYLTQRMKVSSAIVAASKTTTEPSAILAGVTATELQSVIVLACQLAGEIMLSVDDTNTCAALRLAGLEMGMTWLEDNYNDAGGMKAELLDSSSLDLAIRLFANAANQERNWNVGGNDDDGKKKPSKNRRRLEEDMTYDDDEYHDYDEHFDDDEYHMDDAGKDEETDDGQDEEKGPLDHLSGLEKDLVEGLKALPFSATRNAFLNRSEEIIADIAKALEADPDEAENIEEGSSEGETKDDETKEEETKEEGVAAAATPTVDPAAYSMLRNNLRRKEATIVKGLKWGASSLLFFSENADMSEDQLLQLAMYTIFHGNLSALQVWQILQEALDDFIVPPSATDEETCASPWAGSCPPKTIIRQGRITVPAPSLMEAAELFCSQQTEAAMESCSAKTVDENGIPTAIPDGYFGYVTPVPRHEKDAVGEIFAPLTALPVYKDGLENFEKEKLQLEKEQKDIDKKISDIWKDIGGKSGKEMGPNGELHAMANKCFEVLAGKYTYEVCLFGQAKQKDPNNQGGTGLGRYTRMNYDEETGERILYWENGQKCWNGPHRSATVYLTCGPENKVLTADEPDTCRYVLEMESHIACDDKFKERMGL